MNTNDFYKQLMSEYTFDSDKIRENAKKGRFAKQKAIPLYIGFAAAAAVCTVVVGSAIAVGLGGRGGVELVSSEGRAWLPADERLSKALEDIARNENSTEQREVLVSFAAAYSPEEVRSILTAYSNVSVRQVYFADGTKAVGEKEVEAAFAGTNQMTGAVISCEGALMKTLESDARVLTVEEITQADLDVITPINGAGGETAEVTMPDDAVALPEFTPTADENAAVGTDETADDDSTEEWDESAESLEGTEETDESEESQTAQSEETDDESFETDVTGDESSDESEDIPATDETQPSLPIDNLQQETAGDKSGAIPAGVDLPENPEKFSYNTYINAQSAFFMSENVFFVKGENEIALYNFENGAERLAASEYCEDAKICWVSANNGRLLVSALGENGKRSRLLLVDALGGTIIDLNAQDAVMDGTLAGVGYNESANILALNIKEDGKYYLYAARLKDYSEIEYISMCFESKARVTLLAAQGDSIYAAATEGALTQVYRCGISDSGNVLIKTFDNSPVISKNLAFTHAVFAPSEYAVTGRVEIFDPVAESFIKMDFFGETIAFGAAADSFTAGGGCYTISGGTICAAESVDVFAKIDYKKSGSSSYAAAVANGMVKITESVYGVKSGLVFGEYSDSADAELRAAADNAIALTNALALGSCSESGIYTQNTLVETIKACFGQETAQKLMERCGISEYGALRYNGTSLDAIRVCDTSLVISSQGDFSAAGTLYVRAGSYCTNSGWIAYDVSFVKENGCWKMNTVIG